MASKNASLGALDALRTKVRDKSDTTDKKKVESTVKKSSEKSQSGNIAPGPKAVDKAINSEKKSMRNENVTTTATAKVADTGEKKKAGRKKIADNKKRVQITLTISHSANDRLTEWASDMPKSGSRLLSDYIDYHLEDIINYYNKIL